MNVDAGLGAVTLKTMGRRTKSRGRRQRGRAPSEEAVDNYTIPAPGDGYQAKGRDAVAMGFRT